jgi:D-glycero-D-manno-heptose 1,7-bisphosphate phosphatase
MSHEFHKHGSLLTDILYCPYHPKEGIGRYKKDSQDRKPNPGMILRAASLHQIDLNASILIGDKSSDIKAGFKAGIPRNLLFNSGSSFDDLNFNPRFVYKINLLTDAIPFLKELASH